MSSQNTRVVPEPRPYGRVFARVVLTALFSAVLLWAIVVLLTQSHTEGVVAVALAVVMSGAVIGAVSAWQEVRTLSSEERVGKTERDQVKWTKDESKVEECFPLSHQVAGRDEVAV
jgi:hypothetical protein